MRKRFTLLLKLALFFILFGPAPGSPALAQDLNGQKNEGAAMKLTSPEFQNNNLIPLKFSCDGQDINPALIIENTPAGTKSLALIVDDPDAPMGTWVHWVVYDIPVIAKLEENSLPGKPGSNDSNRKNYSGPCPPSGTHRYFFKLYALDKKLDLKEGLDKPALEKAMQGHILEKAELIGLYKR
jgi:Raf kinase inhibitor-like YbhB/YbcL family protein